MDRQHAFLASIPSRLIRRYWQEGQIVEIMCTVGRLDYFTCIANALEIPPIH